MREELEQRADQLTPQTAEVEPERAQPYALPHTLEPEAEHDEDKDEDDGPDPLRGFTRQRMGYGLLVILAVLLAVFLPPLVNMERYRRQITSSIGASLGRPVRIDKVTLDLLPMPGFTLENFVVDEDPAFGSEPVIRANHVQAALRVSSLWRRHVEFSRISLDSPSVNLVHLPDGRWNLQSILLQASRMPAAPTAQQTAGPAQRFPYIQARGGRVNLKLDLEKKPISLIEADFSLWLPSPERWHLRLEAHPARTDTASTDTGTLRAEGTLGRAATLPDVPIDIKSTWTAAPLGAVSRILLGRDAGMRGEMNLSASVAGTMGVNHLQTALSISGLRRADFVPEHTLDAEIACQAELTGVFHAAAHVLCTWPPGAGTGGLTISGAIPELRRQTSAQLTAKLQNIPASALLAALRVASSRVAPSLKLTGRLEGAAACCVADAPVVNPTLSPAPHTPLPETGGLSGQFALTALRLTEEDAPPIADTALASAGISAGEFSFGPLPLMLGGREPAILQGSITGAGLTMHLIGPVLRARLEALAGALPLFGEGLAESLPALPQAGPAVSIPQIQTPIRVDLVSHRSWLGSQSGGWPGGQFGPQTWSTAAPARPVLKPKHRPTHRH